MASAAACSGQRMEMHPEKTAGRKLPIRLLSLSRKNRFRMTMRRQERTVIRRMQGKVLPGTGAAPAPKAFPVVSARTHREMMRLYPRPLPKTSSKLLPALIHLHPHRIRTASRLPLQGIFSLIPGTRLPLQSSSGAETLKTVLTKRR